jgi:hypothetical protein
MTKAQEDFKMNTKASTWVSIVALFLLCLPAAMAQQETEQKGIDQGNYNVKQSIEFGGRFTNLTGDLQAYDTFVNLQQGPRVLDFTLDMHSLDHHATLFDTFYFSNFGYGGDPNMVSRLRIGKNKWYDFNALFRKDENFWDFSLQDNPLNPALAVPNAPANFNPIYNAPPNLLGTTIIGISPHDMNTRRKLGDYSLTLLPTSRVHFRFGYDRNINQGPAFTTLHQGTEQFLLADSKATVNTYRMGVDFRFIPRTNISYDEVWNYFKDDVGTIDPNAQFPVGGGFPLVDLGVSFNPSANTPCAATFQASGLVNPACSGYYTYLQTSRSRTNAKTEQISLESDYWKNFEFSGKFSYTGADLRDNGYLLHFAGLESRTDLGNDSTSGPIFGRHVAAYADLGATWHITNQLSVLDAFHFDNFHNPIEFDSSTCSFFTNRLNVPITAFATTATPPVTCTPPAGTPVVASVTHSSSSAADASLIANSSLLKVDEKTNLLEADWQFNPRVGVHAGWRYRHRIEAEGLFTLTSEIYYPGTASRGDCTRVNPALPVTQANLPTGCTLNSDGSISFVTPNATFVPPDQVELREDAAVFGFWARPTNNWRMTFDTEFMTADNAFTRVSPLSAQNYRFRTTYKPVTWMSLDGNALIWEGKNNVNELYLQHNRMVALSATFNPVEKLSLELGYNYDNIYSQIPICFTSTANGIVNPGIGSCPNVAGLVVNISTYVDTEHTGYFNVSYTPVRRFTAHLGANLTGSDGSELRLDPQATVPIEVTGPLNSKWLHPFGGVDLRLADHWTGKAYWDFYGYHEDPTPGAYQDFYAPRNFRGNLVTLSVRYAF